MKKLRERLSNKKGFTLVELIVVIVIILILAAVLIPNVMRYIDSARKSAFQSEASGYLTEITGYEAEYYAQNSKDLVLSTWNNTDYPLTGFGTDDVCTTVDETTAYTIVTGPSGGSGKIIQAWVSKGAVIGFTYQDDTHYVSWKQDKGWTNVDEKTFPGEATE